MRRIIFALLSFPVLLLIDAQPSSAQAQFNLCIASGGTSCYLSNPEDYSAYGSPTITNPTQVSGYSNTRQEELLRNAITLGNAMKTQASTRVTNLNNTMQQNDQKAETDCTNGAFAAYDTARTQFSQANTQFSNAQSQSYIFDQLRQNNAAMAQYMQAMAYYNSAKASDVNCQMTLHQNTMLAVRDNALINSDIQRNQGDALVQSSAAAQEENARAYQNSLLNKTMGNFVGNAFNNLGNAVPAGRYRLRPGRY